MTMITPDGKPGDKTDGIMLLSMWSRRAEKERGSPVLSMSMGKPSLTLPAATYEAALEYWRKIQQACQLADYTGSDIDKAKGVIDYGSPQGEVSPREMMAQAMTDWYGTQVLPENILFTAGGAGALQIIFKGFNQLNKGIYRALAVSPFYSLYDSEFHELTPINVMNEPNYRLSAAKLNESLMEAKRQGENDQKLPQILLLCDPNNPLGTVITEQEWLEIIAVLKKFPDLKIVIDQAYAEMSWVGKIPSILTLAPELKERVIILRSATKALSAAGERMGILMAFDPELINIFTAKNIPAMGHAGKSVQEIYAQTMSAFDQSYQDNLRDHYLPKVQYVFDRLKTMNALLPNAEFPQGSFYVMADFSDVLGTDIHLSAEKALGRKGKIKTNEELIYSLLFEEGISLAPGQYFGLPTHCGYVRLTCSLPNEDLIKALDKLENYLLSARKTKYDQLKLSLQDAYQQLKELNPTTAPAFFTKINNLAQPESCGDYGNALKSLQDLHTELRSELLKNSNSGQREAAIRIQSMFRKHLSGRKLRENKNEMDEKWQTFVKTKIQPGGIQKFLLGESSMEQRLTVLAFREYLKEHSDPSPRM